MTPLRQMFANRALIFQPNFRKIQFSLRMGGKHHLKIPHICRTLDHSFLVNPSQSGCQNKFDIFLQTYAHINVPMAPDKKTKHDNVFYGLWNGLHKSGDPPSQSKTWKVPKYGTGIPERKENYSGKATCLDMVLISRAMIIPGIHFFRHIKCWFQCGSIEAPSPHPDYPKSEKRSSLPQFLRWHNAPPRRNIPGSKIGTPGYRCCRWHGFWCFHGQPVVLIVHSLNCGDTNTFCFWTHCTCFKGMK